MTSCASRITHHASRLFNIKTILILFVLLAAVYSVVTPIFEASDELWHYPLVQWLSKGNPLPVQDAQRVGLWKQEASQPPLYYYLTGWATAWIDTSDLAEVRRENPHVDNGVITPDGNRNLVVHDPERESFPWRGTVLAVHLVRLLSVLMGAATVWLTYRIALELFPPVDNGGDLGGGAAAINAFTPMFIFISGAVNNDNLTMTLCSLALWMMVKRVRDAGCRMQDAGGRRQETGGRRQEARFAGKDFWQAMGRWLPVGVVLGLGALTKTSALALLPIAALAISIVAWRKASWAEFFAGAMATAVPVLLIAGWWYLRNIQLYGDPTGINAFIDVLGRRAAPASLAQLWGERWGFMLSYWGLFGGVNVPLDNWVYHALNALAIVGVVGVIIYFVSMIWRWFAVITQPASCHSERSEESLAPQAPELVGPEIPRAARNDTTHPPELGGTGIPRAARNDTTHSPAASPTIAPSTPRRSVQRGFAQSRAPLFLVGLFGVIVVALLTQWASVTWSSQGRLVFSAISTWSIFLALGIATLATKRFARPILAATAVFLFGVSALAPFTTIAPAYARSSPLPNVPAPNLALNVTFGDQLKLVGADVAASSVQPGGAIEIVLYWQALKPIAHDYSTFAHLLDQNEIVVAQRDMYPGQGAWPTSQLKPGDIIASHYMLNVPLTAYTPDQLTWEVGVYDFDTQQRLSASGGGDNVRFGSLGLVEQSGDVPNPVTVNLGNQLDLIGYALDRRAAAPNESIQLTLYWRARSTMSIDYTVFTHVLQPPETIWGQKDKPLPPTSSWSIGQVVSDTYELKIKPDAPPGVYEIEVGVYEPQKFERLRIITNDGRIIENFVLLSKVRVK